VLEMTVAVLTMHTGDIGSRKQKAKQKAKNR
jgi:hypothetical protein